MPKKFNPERGATHIIAILDRSGSMVSLTKDMLGGYNTWLDEQKELPGVCLLTTVLFDDQYETFGTPSGNVKDAPMLSTSKYFARGGTALYDAVGKAVSAVRPRVGKKDRALVLIATDGQENQSHEWSGARIKELITELEGEGNWTFSYLSSAPTAWFDSGSMHINLGSTQVMAATPDGMFRGWANVSASTASYRSSPQMTTNNFYDPQTTEQQGDK